MTQTTSELRMATMTGACWPALAAAAEEPAPADDEEGDTGEERRDGHDHHVAVLHVRELVGDDAL